MYIDYFLKFADEAEANAVLYTTEGESQQPNYAAVDVIGIIYKPTGKMLQTDEGEVPEMAPIDGWHVNVRHTEEMEELTPFAVQPKTPSRAWA
jgi:hypothetical protein